MIRADREESGRMMQCFVGRPHFIGGKLLVNELIERLVTIKRLNNVVAGFPGMLVECVQLLTRAIRIADNVEPMPPISLTVVFGPQQLIDYLLE